MWHYICNCHSSEKLTFDSEWKSEYLIWRKFNNYYARFNTLMNITDSFRLALIVVAENFLHVRCAQIWIQTWFWGFQCGFTWYMRHYICSRNSTVKKHISNFRRKSQYFTWIKIQERIIIIINNHVEYRYNAASYFALFSHSVVQNCKFFNRVKAQVSMNGGALRIPYQKLKNTVHLQILFFFVFDATWSTAPIFIATYVYFCPSNDFCNSIQSNRKTVSNTKAARIWRNYYYKLWPRENHFLVNYNVGDTRHCYCYFRIKTDMIAYRDISSLS